MTTTPYEAILKFEKVLHKNKSNMIGGAAEITAAARETDRMINNYWENKSQGDVAQ